jgi:release factor glutamine methyltransferase
LNVERENVRTVLETAIHRLTAAGCDTPRLDAEVLLAHVLRQDRVWLYTHLQIPLDDNQINSFEKLIHRREQREPVAYLVEYKEFFGLEFEVFHSAVLIPRPETELLVETALQIAVQRSQISDRKSVISIADVGTGSGCIAIALAKHLSNVSIIATDVSSRALRLAWFNAGMHHVKDKVAFAFGNLLEPVTEPVDIIASNPPYVSRAELAMAMPEVSRYEPRLALDGGEDGLDVIRLLFPQAKERLKPSGHLLVEIGSTQGQAVTQLAKIYFPQANIQIKKDLAGLDRLLVVELTTHPI